MDLSCILFLSLLATVSGYHGKCPSICMCALDEKGQYLTICNRGDMTSIPISEMDTKTEVLVIRGPRNDLTIGPIFLEFKDLQELRITDSNLPSVGTYSFWGVEKLRIIDLSRNNITAITQDNFKGQEHLKELNLSYNKINGLTSWVFDNLKDLQRRSLAHNLIEKLAHRVFYKVSKLKYLDLSENPLVDLPPDVFKDIMNLRHLNVLSIADMSEILLDLLNSFDQLKVLNLPGNNLLNSSLTLLDSVEKLELLDLSRNQLNGFDDYQVWKLQRIKDVKLENNPLICDRCHMGSLINITRTLQWNVYPICHLPMAIRGMPISNLNETTLDSCIEHNDVYDMGGISENILLIRGNINLFAIGCAVLFIAIIIIVLIVALSMNRHSAKYYTNEDKRDGLYEKNMDTLSVTGNELNYKFSIDDIIYTIDKVSLQSAQPPLIS